MTEPRHETTPAPGWAHTAYTLVAEPPFVPHALQPATIVNALLDRLVPAVLDAVFKRVDLTALVLEHVSIPKIVDSIDLNAIAARIDVEAIIAQVDVSAIAKQVIDEIDLAGIIRDSSGALASEGVVGVRLQSASADDALERIIARFLPGRRRTVPADQAVRPSVGNGVEPSASKVIEPGAGNGVEPSIGNGVEPTASKVIEPGASGGVNEGAPSGDGG